MCSVEVTGNPVLSGININKTRQMRLNAVAAFCSRALPRFEGASLRINNISNHIQTPSAMLNELRVRGLHFYHEGIYRVVRLLTACLLTHTHTDTHTRTHTERGRDTHTDAHARAHFRRCLTPGVKVFGTWIIGSRR